MKKIRVLDYNMDENYYNVDRIIQVMVARGFECSESQARRLWELYSDSMCAEWLSFPYDDNELFGCLEPYFKEVQ